MVYPTYAIIDATVTQTEARFRGLAAKYVEWQLRELGATIIDEPSQADIICITVVSPHEYKCVPRALRRVGVQPLAQNRIKQKVVLGGQGALSPAIFDPYIDVACVGEGRKFLSSLVNKGLDKAKDLPNAWIPGDARLVYPDMEFPWDAPPTMAEDGIVRIYASRSCKKKCLFCHTGWAMAYSENDGDDLTRQYNALIKAGYRVNVVTNDAPALSFFDDIVSLEHFSASYSQVREIISGGISKIIGKVKSVRLGVEAPSNRLRRIIGKPIDTNDLLNVSCELLNAGIGVRWFMIAGLPGENELDYEELKDVVIQARHKISKGALQLSFTAFCPDAAAPLCIAPLDDTYWRRFEGFWKWFFDGEGFTRRVQLFKCAQPLSRLNHAIGSMAAREDELRRGWLNIDPPNWRVQYAYLNKARLAYNVYAKRVGLPLSPLAISNSRSHSAIDSQEAFGASLTDINLSHLS